MKKIVVCNILVIMFMVMFSSVAYASAKIDKSKVGDGVILFEYSGDTSKGDIIAILQKDGATVANTTITSNKPLAIPLTFGTGNYKAIVGQKNEKNQVRPVFVEEVEVKTIDENAMYTASNYNVNYEVSTKAVPAYKEMAGEKEGAEKVSLVYEDIVKNYTYDFDRMNAVLSSAITAYLPVIDEMYVTKKGVCYDYSALLAGALRSQGIPVKLVMGYAPEMDVLHAWNEILVDGEWVVVDSTTDAAYEEAKMEYSFAKDSSKYKVISLF